MQINRVEFEIIKAQLQLLLNYPYFDKELKTYLTNLVYLCDDILEEWPIHGPVMYNLISGNLWLSIKFLSGSTINETPYEMVSCLNYLLDHWTTEKNSISTALLPEKDYYFHLSDVHGILKRFSKNPLDLELIQIALPKVYKHFPLYNVALYHELGHFIDLKYSVSKYMMLTKMNMGLNERHVQEYFADLFAASYTGRAISMMLCYVFGDLPESSTHPSSKARQQTVDAFLNNEGSQLIDNINIACEKMTKKRLSVSYNSPDIANVFNDIRPCKLNSVSELHGVFEAGWHFVTNPKLRADGPWQHITEFDAFKNVNDLVEKSIRNYVVEQKWNC